MGGDFSKVVPSRGTADTFAPVNRHEEADVVADDEEYRMEQEDDGSVDPERGGDDAGNLGRVSGH